MEALLARDLKVWQRAFRAEVCARHALCCTGPG
jgi:hypothetical protein